MNYPAWDDIRNSTFTRMRNYPMIDADMPTFMARPLAISPADLRGADAVIIGAPYAAGWTTYAGLDKREWLAGPKRVRQQSVRYASGYVQEFDLDVFEHCRVVDFGDAHIPPEVNERPTVDNILRAQAAVEEKVNQALDAGGDPPGVAGDLAQVVEHREIGARGLRHADALDQPLLVGAGELGGLVLEAHALELHVARQDAIAGERQVAGALEELGGLREELRDLADPPVGEEGALGLHAAHAADQPLDGVAGALEVRGNEAEALALGLGGQELLGEILLALVDVAPEGGGLVERGGVVALEARPGQREHLEDVLEHGQQRIAGSHGLPSLTSGQAGTWPTCNIADMRADYVRVVHLSTAALANLVIGAGRAPWT